MMQYFDRISGRLAGYLCLLLLFLPKINLITLGGNETAGLRIDDLVLFCFALVFLWSRLSLRRSTMDIEKITGAIFLLSLTSYFFNRLFVELDLLHVNASILYALRPLEYFLFFYIGLIAFSFFRLRSIVYLYFVLNALIIILQKLGLAGGFTNYGYEPDVTDRPPGLASFPSEMALLLNMMFCCIIYRDEGEKSVRIPYVPRGFVKRFQNGGHMVLFLLVGFLIILTGSRIAILAHIISFIPLVFLMFRFGSPLKFLGITMLILASIAIFYLSIDKVSGLVERSSGLFSWKNVDLIGEVWENIDVAYTPTGHEIVDRAGGDESWWIRIHKWMYGLKIYSSHPECYLQGIGPGFATAAMDGGLLRILVELGLFGLLAFGRFFSLIAQQSRALYWSVICFMINMIFFDAYLAYKSMTLLLLMAGFSYAKNIEQFHILKRA
jgi:hypothetical protein